MQAVMPRPLGKLLAACAIVVAVAAAPLNASPRPASPKAESATVAIDSDDIGGVVTSSKGPEAGVWVIAE
ncbi:MAG TPA: hypothetical protein VG892_04585, partial [Terriglobales bacterium]|nr:hypothetical protein [Terriglobales bacterium]